MSLKSQQPLLTTWKYWRRSFRGRGHWLTQELDPGNRRLLYPSPLFVINVPLKPYYCMIVVIDIPIPEGRKWNRHRKEFAILTIFRIWPSRIPFPVGSDSKCGRPGFYPWVGKISWRRAWQPTPVILPKESQGQRSLEGCSPQGRRVRHDWATKHSTHHTQSESCHQGLRIERTTCYWDHLDSTCDWTSKGLNITFKIWWVGADLYSSFSISRQAPYMSSHAY